MSQNSSIEWTDSTWNPIRGCSRVSPGCLNCYAEKVASRFSDPGQSFHLFADRLPKPHWTGKVELVEDRLLDPMKWRKPKRIFVNSMSDLFHEGLSDEAIDRVFAVMALCPQQTFQILTKRPERMLKWSGSPSGQGWLHRRGYIQNAVYAINHDAHFRASMPLSNVWIGVSVEDQATADARIPLLLKTPAAVRFVSYEPALGPVDFENLPSASGIGRYLNALNNSGVDPGALIPTKLDQIIVGGESGHGARPFDIQWARNTVAQCRDTGVACFVKQLGADPVTRVPGCTTGGTQWHLKDRKGGDMSEWPEDIRVRQFPKGEVIR